MDQTFRCTACNATQPNGPYASESIRCAYCGATVMVPEALRITPVKLPPGFSLGKISEGEFLLHIAEVSRIVYLVQHGQSREATQLYAQTFRVNPFEAKHDLSQLLAAIANPKRAAKPERPANESVLRERTVIINANSSSSAGRRVALAFWLLVTVFVSIYYVRFGGQEQLTQLLNDNASPFAQIAQTIQGQTVAKSVLQFGEEGIGGGQFSEATAVAVDDDGNIYVAEAEGGRVQIFDASGKFQTQWFLPSKDRVLKMVADRQNGIWVLQGAKLTRYQAEDGQPMQTVQYGIVSLASDMAVTMDDSLVVAFFSGDDELVRFNDDLQPVRAFGDLISSQSGDSSSMPRIAVDGMDTTYALAGNNQAVILKFDADGKFLDRIENRDNDGDKFWTLSQIAVDGKGHLFATARNGVLVMDGSGNYLGTIYTSGYPANLAVSTDDELFVVTAHQVTKYLLNQ
ncbi:MAG: NHL repeat-containing protein [Caldilineaceae bacterium]